MEPERFTMQASIDFDATKHKFPDRNVISALLWRLCQACTSKQIKLPVDVCVIRKGIQAVKGWDEKKLLLSIQLTGLNIVFYNDHERD